VSFWSVVYFAGGVGLFLVGMRLMTDGLRTAAGSRLKSILIASTRSRLRGLLSGALITAAVQASGAVIFATVGFVNAGLLTLQQSIGVIYGANLGTTLTSWIVALLGFNVDLQALALPAIALGVTLRIVSRSLMRQAFGDALVGFGLFFLGIEVLRDTFAEVGEATPLQAFAGHGLLSLLLFIVLGFALTVLMQSSSAALVIVLTAAAGGLVPLAAAAAAVIGANVGTTSIAVFAVIGATPNARRSAAAHVVFNVVTAVVALAILPALLWLSGSIAAGLGLGAQVAVVLAVFHTLTKVLGVILMWPLTGWLVRWLEQRFRSTVEDASRPRYLDSNVLRTPVLALEAAILELQRAGGMTRQLAGAALSAEGPDQLALQRERDAVHQLCIRIGEFVNGIERGERQAEFDRALPDLMRVVQYYQEAAERALEVASLRRGELSEIPAQELATGISHVLARAASLINATGSDTEHWTKKAGKAAMKEWQTEYQEIKNRLLRAGATGTLSVQRMVAVLDRMSVVRRIVEQHLKAARYLRRSLRIRDQLEEDDLDLPGDNELAGDEPSHP